MNRRQHTARCGPLPTATITTTTAASTTRTPAENCPPAPPREILPHQNFWPSWVCCPSITRHRQYQHSPPAPTAPPPPPSLPLLPQSPWPLLPDYGRRSFIVLPHYSQAARKSHGFPSLPRGYASPIPRSTSHPPRFPSSRVSYSPQPTSPHGAVDDNRPASHHLHQHPRQQPRRELLRGASFAGNGTRQPSSSGSFS